MNLSPIRLGVVFTGWGLLVAIFAVFGAPRLQARFGIATTMYANLAAFALVILVIGIWTTDRAVLIPAVIASGVVIGVNNTITTQAVMTIAPVERPVASAAYSFVRCVGGGLAPYVAGRLVVALNIHVPFFIAAGAVVLGILILTTARRTLADAERAQAEEVAAHTTAPAPAERRVAVAGAGIATSSGVIVAAVDDSPTAAIVVDSVPRMAAESGQAVHVVHAIETAIGGDVAVDGEGLDEARALVHGCLDQLARYGVPTDGQLLLHANDHGAAGRMIADYANSVSAGTVVIGAPTHGGLAALVDGSSSSELLRRTRSDVLIINPESAMPLAAEPAGAH
jgi:MFS transporter, ACDE family, multidrug resistance protein